MATKKTAVTDAAKARKQKIVLFAAGGVLLLLAAIQVPKLMQHRGNAAPAPVSEAASSTGSAATPSSTPGTSTATAPTPTTVIVGKAGAVVAGVALPLGPTAAKAADGQLASFTLFEAKDPFVPKDGSDAQTPGEKAADAQQQPAQQPAQGGANGAGATSGSGGSTPQAPPAPIVYATINLDGKPQQVTLKDEFPQAVPLFVLRSVKKNQAKIAVAGGTFDGGGTITLTLGKKVTLVNTATGVRYVLKLVYTGAQPEVIEGFTTGKAGATTAAGDQAAGDDPAAADQTTTAPATTTAG